jgi:DNA-directed RNA polymerase
MVDGKKQEGFKIHDYCKHPDWNREVENENKMFLIGKELAKKNINNLNQCGHGSLTPGVRRLNESDIFRKVQDEYCRLLNLYTGTRTGPRPRWYKLLSPLDLGTTAWIAIKTTEDLLISTPSQEEVTRQNLALEIGAEIENDLYLTYSHTQTENWRKKLKAESNKWKSIFRREWKEKQRCWLQEWKEDVRAWTVDDKACCGLVLLEALKNASIVQFVDSRARREDNDLIPIQVVELTPKIEAAFLKNNNQIADNSPKHLPMVYMPENWETVRLGGYLRNDLCTSLVKSHYPEQLRGITTKASPIVFRAANGIQSTPWRINRFLLFVMLKFWRKRKYELFFSKKKDRYKKSACRQIKSYLRTASSFSQEERFWLPVNMDYRGRLYYIPSLNPQGPDYVRALLEFADGRELWLNTEPLYSPSECTHSSFMLYGESLFGLNEDRDARYFDKEMLETATAEEYAEIAVRAAKYPQRRDSWIRENEQKILDSANDPFQNQWWTGAKKPWTFLRWCIEYRDCQNAGKPIRSHLPIYTDMTCNGFQHLCALVRDEKTGSAVNLTGDLVPHDLYCDIAEKVRKKVESFKDEKWAKGWIDIGINRKLVKPVVMSMPYGSQSLSHADGLQDFLENLPSDKQQFKESEFVDASWWMAKIIRNTIEEQNFPAIDLLSDLKKIAKCVSEPAKCVSESGKCIRKPGKHLAWTSPSGFPVRQLCFQEESREIRTNAGSLLRMRLNVKKHEINSHKAQNKIAANLIHSLDASVLHIVVCHCLDHDITSLAVIHDSFATWSYSLPSVEAAMREAFFKIHSQNLLPLFWNHFVSLVPPEKRSHLTPPPQGELDLTQVFTSSYMSF